MTARQTRGGAPLALSSARTALQAPLWHIWFANYKRFLLHYATLADAWNITQFVVTHELYLVNGKHTCP